jgi:hypothetical protein
MLALYVLVNGMYTDGCMPFTRLEYFRLQFAASNMRELSLLIPLTNK